MFSLVYKSKARFTFSLDDINELLNQAREFNQNNDITGCLLYYQGDFLQFLEGGEKTVLELFDRIKVDERHHDVILLSYDYIPERIFPSWDMAYENFLATNHQLEYLKLYVKLFVQIPSKSLAVSRTSQSFWNMVKQLITQPSIDK